MYKKLSKKVFVIAISAMMVFPYFSNLSVEASEENSGVSYSNVPENITATSNVESQPGHGFEMLFDKDLRTHYHSIWSNPKFKELVINLGKIYDMDKLEYYPRTDRGNGTIIKTDISVSIDGVHYKKIKENVQWERDGEVKTVKFDGISKFKFIKFHNLTTIGGFGSAREIIPYAKDPIMGTEAGDYNNTQAIDDGDLTLLRSYSGLSKEHNDSEFNGNVENADVNFNGMIDAVDISFVSRDLQGGLTENTEQSPKGYLTLVSDKSQVSKDEEFYVNVYGLGLENVNAFSTSFEVDPTKYEVMSYETVDTRDMESFSNTRTHGDGVTTANVVYANVGNKYLIEGTGVIARVKLKSKLAQDVNLKLENSLIVNRGLEYINADIAENVEPTEQSIRGEDLGLQDLTISVKNDEMADYESGDDIFQQSNWKELLFDKNLDRLAEFKWYFPGKKDQFPAKVKLPMEFKFDLNEPTKISEFSVANRLENDPKKVNGIVTSITAKYIDENDELHTISDINEQRDMYDFDMTNIKDKVKSLIFIVNSTKGLAPGANDSGAKNRMLSLREVTIKKDISKEATSIEFDNFKSEINVGEKDNISVIVTPDNSEQKLYTLESSNPDVLEVKAINTPTNIYYFIKGLKQGTATLIATLKSNNNINVSEEINVVGKEPIVKTTVTRVKGESRYSTAIASSVASYDNAESVVLATGENYPDALVAGPLGKALNAPILLTKKEELVSGVSEEIQRLGAKKVYVIGSEKAISNNVLTKLEKLGLKVERIAGDSRYTTSIKVAEKIEELSGKPTEIVIATGENFPDAVISGPYAFKKNAVIILTPKNVVLNAIKEYLSSYEKGTKVTVLGSELAVSSKVTDVIKNYSDQIERISGESRYSTSVEVAKAISKSIAEDMNSLIIATGENYPDTLVANNLVNSGKYLAPIIIVNEDLYEQLNTFIEDNKDKIKKIIIMGDEKAVKADIEAKLNKLVK